MFAAETEPYFRQNGVLYLDTDAVQKMADALNQAQPFLGTLTADPSLHGLFTLLNRAVSASDTAGIDLSPVFAKLAEGVDDAAAGKFSPLSWQDMMGQQNAAGGDPTRRFIDVKPSLDFSRMLAAGSAIAEIRAQAAKLGLDEAHGVRVRLTGSRVLEQEEIQSALGGGLRALSAALVMVAVLLYLALRSARLVIAAVATLAAGLLVTAAFAAAVVGQLNLISIAFSVLYVGLGIDYALYLCMQYRELIGTGVPPREALPRAAGDVAGFMLVCACTTSLGFFAFVPTAFTGIAELGLISGVGMFISLAMSLSVLPAFISLLPPDPARVVLRPPGGSSPVLDWPYKHARLIWIGAAVLAAGAAWLAPRAYFDYDPLDLRDPKSESVSTFRDLLKDPNVPALSLAVVTDSPEQAKALEDKLSKLPLVAHAISLPDLVPQDQDAMHGILRDLNLTVGPTFASHPGPMKITVNDDDYAAIDQLHGALPAYLAKTSGPTQQAAQSLLKALDGLEQSWSQGDSAAHETLLARLRQVLLGTLPAQVDDACRPPCKPGQVSEQDLPPQLAQRWEGSTDDTGHTLVPRRDLAQGSAGHARGHGALRGAGAHGGAQRGGPAGGLHRVRAFGSRRLPPGLRLLLHRHHHPAAGAAAQPGGRAVRADPAEPGRPAHRGRLGAAEGAVQLRQCHRPAADPGSGRGLRRVPGAARPRRRRRPHQLAAHRHRPRGALRRAHHHRQLRQPDAGQASGHREHGRGSSPWACP